MVLVQTISINVVLPKIKMIVGTPLYFSIASKLEWRKRMQLSLTEENTPKFILYMSWFLGF